MSLIKSNSHCASIPDRIAMLQGQGYTAQQCEAACAAHTGCTQFAIFDQSNAHSRPYYGRCDIYRKCSGYIAWSGLQNYTFSAHYGSTHVENYQAMGETNFRNSADRGDTQVDNLIGTQGSVQNFGLLVLL